MGDFEETVAVWRATPFPLGSANEALDELHADLALADTWVAEAVIPYVGQGQWTPAQVDVIAETEGLVSRAAGLVRAHEGEDRIVGEAYRAYANLLLRVYRGFLARGEPQA